MIEVRTMQTSKWFYNFQTTRRGEPSTGLLCLTFVFPSPKSDLFYDYLYRCLFYHPPLCTYNLFPTFKASNQAAADPKRPKFRLQKIFLLRSSTTLPHLHLSFQASVTRLGDLLHFGQLFRACGNNYFAQIANILGNFGKVVEILHFASEIIFGQIL